MKTGEKEEETIKSVRSSERGMIKTKYNCGENEHWVGLMAGYNSH